MTTTTSGSQDRDMFEIVFDGWNITSLDVPDFTPLLIWISENLDPEDIFEDDSLSGYASVDEVLEMFRDLVSDGDSRVRGFLIEHADEILDLMASDEDTAISMVNKFLDVALESKRVGEFIAEECIDDLILILQESGIKVVLPVDDDDEGSDAQYFPYKTQVDVSSIKPEKGEPKQDTTAGNIFQDLGFE